jgi:hypothetical protein
VIVIYLKEQRDQANIIEDVACTIAERVNGQIITFLQNG